MLPEGAVHLPYKGIAKVAKGLSISYAEAVTSFEFKRLKATPILTGIVVAKESEDAVLEAYWKSAAAAEEREKARRETQALKRWAKLVNGLRIRTRLRAVYGDGEDVS
jgi:xeroderma pigmentosum group C-complementing protein